VLLQGDMNAVRVDKWLWAARFFKTRSLAARACEIGRVQCNNQSVKPAHDVRVGEILQIRTEAGEFEVEVLLLSEIRGPASVAQTLYLETESSREKRLRFAQERRSSMLSSPAPENRPSKRDRRRIRQFRGE
jgi:ribosome-associated heat shock protein Hsp15